MNPHSLSLYTLSQPGTIVSLTLNVVSCNPSILGWQVTVCSNPIKPGKPGLSCFHFERLCILGLYRRWYFVPRVSEIKQRCYNWLQRASWWRTCFEMRPRSPFVVPWTVAETSTSSHLGRRWWLWPFRLFSRSLPPLDCATYVLFQWPLDKRCVCWLTGCIWRPCWLLPGLQQRLPVWPSWPYVHQQTCRVQWLIDLEQYQKACWL